MVVIGHPQTLGQLKLKVAEVTQERPTPFHNGVLGLGWVKRFRLRHPNLALQVARALEQNHVKGLCPMNVEALYDNLIDAYGSHNYTPD